MPGIKTIKFKGFFPMIINKLLIIIKIYTLLITKVLTKIIHKIIVLPLSTVNFVKIIYVYFVLMIITILMEIVNIAIIHQ